MAVNHRILSPARLPIPPLSRGRTQSNTADRRRRVLGFAAKMPQSAGSGRSGVLLALLFVATLGVQSCQNFLLQGFNEDKVYQSAAGQFRSAAE